MHRICHFTYRSTTRYWYHPDHLGSASWVSDKAGKGIQHLYYLPWGEELANQRGTAYESRYTFSGKERDVETGYSYFGARYYNSDLSIWLSVDPLADKYPGLSPYTYCADNPVKLVDPDGRDYEVVFDHEKKTITIQATYYVKNIDDYVYLQRGLRVWNRQSGRYKYTTDDGIEYTINFNLTGYINEEGFKAASKVENENRGAAFNAFQITDVCDDYKDGDRGITRNGHVCYIKTTAPFRTILHEIGHTLGLGEFNGSDNVMVSGGDGECFNKTNIYEILSTAGFKCSANLPGGGQQRTIPNSIGTLIGTDNNTRGKLETKNIMYPEQ